MTLPIVYHPDYVAPLPAGHRFPMPKFRLLWERLLREGIASEQTVYRPAVADTSWLTAVHDPDYVQAFCTGHLDPQTQRRIGLPWSEALVRRTCLALSGTVLAAQLALSRGIACNTAGGTHHAFPGYGSGFCIFNDLAVAARYLLNRRLVQRVLIVDLDVHQGDGTALAFQDEPRVFTFSMHCQDNFPARKQRSDWDLPLPVGVEDAHYLATLADCLPGLLEQVRPDLVLYDAGVDVHVADRLGKLALTDTGLYCREMQVLQTCLQRGYPVACVIGGGYSEDMASLVWRHSLVFRAAAEMMRQYRL
ncbi:MAG: histone deacetylase [Gloeomargaritaceae cyanobacterium C42_A2020_066]|nr:histone deacetylase [Gloeomargaritaceae cyanobacterium C42_A2020_066]